MMTGATALTLPEAMHPAQMSTCVMHHVMHYVKHYALHYAMHHVMPYARCTVSASGRRGSPVPWNGRNTGIRSSLAIAW